MNKDEKKQAISKAIVWLGILQTAFANDEISSVVYDGDSIDAQEDIAFQIGELNQIYEEIK